MEVFEIEDVNTTSSEKKTESRGSYKIRHKFASKFFKNPEVCVICKGYIWGLNSEGFQCSGKLSC